MIMMWMKIFKITKDSSISEVKEDSLEERPSPSDTLDSPAQVINHQKTGSEHPEVNGDVEIFVPNHARDTNLNHGRIPKRNARHSNGIEDLGVEPAHERRKVVKTFPMLERIKQGVRVFHNKPWMVSIEENLNNDRIEDHVCGGVLIHKKWVLTAAHCLENADEIWMGSNNLNGHSIHRKISESGKFKHPKYNGQYQSHDIALLELNEEVEIQSCLPELSSADPAVQSNCKIYGWGQYHGGSVAPELREADVPVVEQWLCKQRYWINFHHICAGYEYEGPDACKGDSGGPLMCKDINGRMTVHGIISFGMNCDYSSYGVYTSVYKHKCWIRDIILRQQGIRRVVPCIPRNPFSINWPWRP